MGEFKTVIHVYTGVQLYMQTLKLLNIIVFNNIRLCKHGRKVCYGFHKKNSLLQELIERETLTSSEVFSKDCDVTTVLTCLMYMY